MARKLSEALAGDAGSNVDPNIIQACLAEYTEVNTEIGRLSQRQSAMLARYEKQGVNIKSIKNTHRASKLDKRVATAQAQSDVRYLVITGILSPANDDWVRKVTQSDMFARGVAPPGAVSPQLARARAHSDGYNSGRHGAAADTNPHKPGSAEHVAWLEGLKDGQEDRALKPGTVGVMQANDGQPKRGRGRPPGKAAGNGAGASAAA